MTVELHLALVAWYNQTNAERALATTMFTGTPQEQADVDLDATVEFIRKGVDIESKLLRQIEVLMTQDIAK